MTPNKPPSPSQLSEADKLMFGLESKNQTSIHLTPNEKWLLGAVGLILANEYEGFFESESGSTLNRYDLTTTILRLEELIKRLKVLKAPENDALAALDGLSVQEMKEAVRLATERRDQMRANAIEKKAQQKPAQDAEATSYFRKAINRLTGNK